MRLGRLNDDSQRFCTVDGAVGDARGELRGVIDHDRGGTPAADGAHLRVVGCTDDDRLPSLDRSLGHDLMDALADGPDFLDRFDAELFDALVEKIIVDSNERLRFRLKNGLELTEQIERTRR